MGRTPLSADSAFTVILDALSHQAATSFQGVTADIEQHVLPTTAAIARSLVVIGARLKDGTYDGAIAAVEVEAQVDAAAAVLVRFANRVLKEIEDLVNAVLDAVRGVVNQAIGVALL